MKKLILFILIFGFNFTYAYTGLPDSLGKGLVGYWTFNGGDISNGTALDRSGNGNTGQLINIATSTFYTTGEVGQAFNFDGVNDYLRISSTTPVQGFNPITIAFWAKANTVALSKTPAAKHGDAGTNAEWIFKTTTSGSVFMRGIWYLSGGPIVLTDSTVLDTKWHHWVLRGNGTIATLFKDGVQVATGSGTGTANSFSNSDIQIGRQDTVDAAYWPGRIDEFRIYKRALSNNEIKQLYNFDSFYFGTPQKDSSLGAGLKLWYTFDGKDVSNGTFIDRSGNGNTGTPVSIATSTFYNKGNIGQGVFFNGSGSYIQPTSDPIGLSTTTISVWVNINSFSGIDSSLFIIYGNNTRFRLSQTNSRVEWSNNGFTNTCVSANINSTKNKWTHILVTRNENQVVNIYVNGVLSGTANQTCGSTTSALLGKIGISVTNSNKFIGYMDDLRVYNRVLGQQEIKQLYNLGQAYFGQLSVDQNASLGKGLVGWWTFDGKNTSWTSSTAGTTLDESGNGLTGTMSNMFQATSTASGIIGQAMNFFKRSQVTVADTNLLSFGNSTTDSPFTFSAWVKRKPGGNMGILTKSDNTAGVTPIEYLWYIDSSGKLAIILYDNSGGNQIRTVSDTATTADIDKWTFYTVTYDGSSTTGGLKLYRNGQAFSSTGATSGIYVAMENSTRLFRMGSAFIDDGSSKQYMQGAIDDVRVYNRVLTNNEIKTLYNMGQVYFKN